MTDGEILLREILDNPGDDLPRLKYADWLDENARINPCPTCYGGLSIPLADLPAFRAGKRIAPCPTCQGSREVGDGNREYAEFIRSQCESAAIPRGQPGEIRNHKLRLQGRATELFKYVISDDRPFHEWCEWAPDDALKPLVVYRRGFVAEIRCTVERFVGRHCSPCAGGVRMVYPPGSKCSSCNGTHRTGGIAAAVFREHPVTSVVLTCREPLHRVVRGHDRYCWSFGGQSSSHGISLPLCNYLPHGRCKARDPFGRRTVDWWSDRRGALNALSEAACKLGRSLAFPVSEQVAVEV